MKWDIPFGYSKMIGSHDPNSRTNLGCKIQADPDFPDHKGDLYFIQHDIWIVDCDEDILYFLFLV